MLATLLPLLMCTTLDAQTGKLIGSISQAPTRLTAKTVNHDSDIEITLKYGDIERKLGVDEDGYFEFDNIPVGFAELEVLSSSSWPFSEMVEITEGDNFIIMFITFTVAEGEEYIPFVSSDPRRKFPAYMSARYVIPKAKSKKGKITIEHGLFADTVYKVVITRSAPYPKVIDGVLFPAVSDSTTENYQIKDKAVERLTSREGVKKKDSVLTLDSSKYRVTTYKTGVLINCL